MSDTPLDHEIVDGVEYDIEQTDNSVKPEDGDQSGVSQTPTPDIDAEVE